MLHLSCEIASSFLASSKHCSEGELLVQWGPERLGTRHSMASAASCLPVQELAASCFTPGCLAGSWGSRGELVQLVARKPGLLLGEEGFIAIDDLCSS